METRIELAADDDDRAEMLRETLRSLEGVRAIEVDEADGALIVDHDQDVITAEELIGKAGSEGEVVTDDQETGDQETGAADPGPDPRAEGAGTDRDPGDLPRTTTTGDVDQDMRSAGDGAIQDVGSLEEGLERGGGGSA